MNVFQFMLLDGNALYNRFYLLYKNIVIILSLIILFIILITVLFLIFKHRGNGEKSNECFLIYAVRW